MPVLDGFRNLKATCTETARSQRICAKIGWLTPVSEGGGEGGEDVEQRHGDISVSATRPHDPSLGLREPRQKVVAR